MLVHHLIQRGFDHDEAYGIADEVRTEVRQRKEVERGQILELIAGLLKRDHPDRPLGNLLFWEPAPTTITVDRDAGPRPFSPELLSHSIQAAGLSPGRSYELARTVEERLLDSGASRIDHGELENLVEEVILDKCDESSAERYRTWRAWGDLNQPLVILIGGATGVGKTTLAVSLANVLDIPRVVATEDIRQILRLTLAKDFTRRRRRSARHHVPLHRGERQRHHRRRAPAARVLAVESLRGERHHQAKKRKK